MTLTLHSFLALVAAPTGFYVSVLIWGMFLGNLMEILPGNENLFGVPVRAKPKCAVFLISGYQLSMSTVDKVFVVYT